MKIRKIVALLAIALLLSSCIKHDADGPRIPVASESTSSDVVEPSSTEAVERDIDRYPDPVSYERAEYDPHYEVRERLLATGEYRWIDEFHEGYAQVCVVDSLQYGYSDESGQIVIPAEYTEAYFDFPWGLNWYSSNEYDYWSFSEGVAGYAHAVDKNTWTFGYIDTDGNTIIQPVFQAGGRFSGGIASIVIDDTFRYIDRSGDIFTEYQSLEFCLYDFPNVVQEGLYPIKNQDGLCGYMNSAGEVVIECSYLDIGPFSEGLAAVQDPDSELWGYIDADGDMVIPPSFFEARAFSEGVAVIVVRDALEQREIAVEEDRVSVQDLFEGIDGPFNYIDREGTMLFSFNMLVSPRWPGNPYRAPEVMQCQNGIIATSACYAYTGSLYNKQGELIDFLRDCPEELQDYEKPVVGVWRANERDENSGDILKLYRDRTMLRFNERGDMITQGSWACRPELRGFDFVWVQDDDGNVSTIFLNDTWDNAIL